MRRPPRLRARPTGMPASYPTAAPPAGLGSVEQPERGCRVQHMRCGWSQPDSSACKRLCSLAKNTHDGGTKAAVTVMPGKVQMPFRSIPKARFFSAALTCFYPRIAPKLPAFSASIRNCDMSPLQKPSAERRVFFDCYGVKNRSTVSLSFMAHVWTPTLSENRYESNFSLCPLRRGSVSLHRM